MAQYGSLEAIDKNLLFGEISIGIDKKLIFEKISIGNKFLCVNKKLPQCNLGTSIEFCKIPPDDILKLRRIFCGT